MEKAKKACSDYGFHMGVTWYGDQVKKEMEKVLEEDGIRSFKVFLAYRGSWASPTTSSSACCRPAGRSAR